MSSCWYFARAAVNSKVLFGVDFVVSGLAEAPSTIREREELQRIQRENIFYTPKAGEVPEIAVPDFLPDLLGWYFPATTEICDFQTA